MTITKRDWLKIGLLLTALSIVSGFLYEQGFAASISPFAIGYTLLLLGCLFYCGYVAISYLTKPAQQLEFLLMATFFALACVLYCLISASLNYVSNGYYLDFR